MNEPIRVHELHAKDPHGTVLEMYERAGDGLIFGTPDVDGLSRLTRDTGTRVLVAEYSRTVIGAALVHRPAPGPLAERVPWFGRDDLAVIRGIAVEPALRGMGVASALLARAESLAHEHGAAHLAAALTPAHDGLAEALARRGYRPVARIEQRDGMLLVVSKTLGTGSARAA